MDENNELNGLCVVTDDEYCLIMFNCTAERYYEIHPEERPVDNIPS